MTGNKRKTKLSAVEALQQDQDLMRALVREAMQQILEAEMTEQIGAAPGERSEGRLGYRAGYYTRNFITRIGKLSCASRATVMASSPRSCLSATSARRRRS